MFYPENLIEDIRNENDIVDVISSYVPLKQKGRQYFGLCPFHKEHTPSFSVSADEQLFHCFGCGASGNVFSFIMQIENYDFVDAIKFLAQRINYQLPENDLDGRFAKNNQIKNTVYEIHKNAARFYYSILNSDEGKKAIKYLDERQISLKARRKFGLGFSSGNRKSLSSFLIKQGYSDEALSKSGLVFYNKNGTCYDKFFNRLMFPIIDYQGRIIAFGGRVIDSNSEPKYLNSPDTIVFKKSQNLFGINFARKSSYKEFILVEGYMDVISLYQAGFHNTVAALGTAFNDDHARTLKKYANSVIILFDSDLPGTNAALKAGPVLIKNGIRVKVLQVNDAKDPDEFIKKFGYEAFSNLLNTAQSFVIFQINCERKKYNLNSTEEKIIFTNKVADILSHLDNSIERDAYINETVSITGISKEAIVSQISKVSSAASINNFSRKYNKSNIKADAKGVEDAKKNIIKIMASNYSIYKKIRDVLSPDEFVNPIYIKLIKIIDEFYRKGLNIYSAEIVSYFDSLEEQKTVSEILIHQKNDYQEDSQNKYGFQKELNDLIKSIKLFYLDNILKPSAVAANDIETLQKITTNKKNVEGLNITLSDG